MRAVLAVLAALAASLLAILLVPAVGAEPVDAGRAWRDWWGLPRADWGADARILDLRLARAVLAWLAGGALAAAGAVLQTLLRNGLATPYTLGVAAASSFGAFVVIALPSVAWLAALGTTGAALLCALGCLALVLRVARHSTHADGLLLAGIVLNFLFGAGVMLVRYLTDPFELAQMERWLLGSVEAVSLRDALRPAGWLALSGVVLATQVRALDQLAFDEELAAARGVRVARARAVALLGAGLMTAAVVAVTGPIGFLGLLVPHAVRPFTGLRHATLLPATFFAGGAFLVVADLLARSVSVGGRHSEIPVGIVTALVGGPCFLLLLTRRPR